MRSFLLDALCYVTCGFGLAGILYLSSSARSSLAPAPVVQPIVVPVSPAVPNPPSTPARWPRPRLPNREDIIPQRQGNESQGNVGSDTAPDGKTEVQCDLPTELRLKNKGGSDGRGGPGTGSGLCVFTSINHSAHWQNVDALKDFRDWMTKLPGGGDPEKVDRMIEKKCKELGMPKPEYIQVERADLDILLLALKTGRMPSITYAYSPTGRYNGKRISHMVSLVHLDDKWAGVLDNNYPDALEWLTPDQLRKTFKQGSGWCVILLAPPPPPVPKN